MTKALSKKDRENLEKSLYEYFDKELIPIVKLQRKRDELFRFLQPPKLPENLKKPIEKWAWQDGFLGGFYFCLHFADDFYDKEKLKNMCRIMVLREVQPKIKEGK
ncbi:MAG: hypothetical protein ACFFCW_22880 [Candidatus Hodarchaeota archaeon]